MCHFIFSKSLLILPPFQNQHFARLKRIEVPPKEEKCHFLISLIKRHFFFHFYMPFHFFKVPFDFASLPKAAFFKAKVHRGSPKGRKMQPCFCSNGMAFFRLYFSKVSFDFASLPKPAFGKAKAHRGTPKEEKVSHVFFAN